MSLLFEYALALYRAGDNHLKTYLNLMKMNPPKTKNEKKMHDAAHDEHSRRKMLRTLTSKGIREKKINEEPTNVMGTSSSTQGAGAIATFDPILVKRKLKRFGQVIDDSKKNNKK